MAMRLAQCCWVAGEMAGPCAAAARSYHRRRDPLTEIMGTTYQSPEGEGAVVEALAARLGHIRIHKGKEDEHRIGKQVLELDYGLTYSAYFSRFRPVEYNPEPINTPGPSRTSKVFPRYKLIEQSELFNTIMATQRFLRQKANANEVLATPKPAETSRILGQDDACGSKRYTFFFTDTSESADDETRRVWIRERDGVLRTAGPEERDRAMATFRPRLHTPLRLPGVFKSDAALGAALDAHQHAHVLDTICRIRSRDSRAYVQVHVDVYRHLHSTGLYSLLQDTPHFYGFLRWALFEDRALPAVNTDQYDALADVLDLDAKLREPTNRIPLARLLSELVKGGRADDAEALANFVATRGGLPRTDAASSVEAYAKSVADDELMSLLSRTSKKQLKHAT